MGVLDAVADLDGGFELSFEEFPWGSAYYAETGRMMPDDGLDQLRAFEAIYLGAVGFPGVPDHVSLWGLLIPIRRGFHQYVNLRPVRLLNDRLTPLLNRKTSDIDFVVFRENTEGAYCGAGGFLKHGTADEIALQDEVNTRRGVERIIVAAFEYARANGRKSMREAPLRRGPLRRLREGSWVVYLYPADNATASKIGGSPRQAARSASAATRPGPRRPCSTAPGGHQLSRK